MGEGRKKDRKGEHGDNCMLTQFRTAPVRFLHVVSAMASMATTMPPVRVAAIRITAALHPVIILTAFRLVAIVVAVAVPLARISTHRQTAETK
jgi:hypothetical protein